MKKKVPVEIVGATVCHADGGWIGFLTEKNLLLWVERSREYQHGYSVGSLWWVYAGGGKVLGAVPLDCAREELPEPGEAEIEIG